MSDYWGLSVQIEDVLVYGFVSKHLEGISEAQRSFSLTFWDIYLSYETRTGYPVVPPEDLWWIFHLSKGELNVSKIFMFKDVGWFTPSLSTILPRLIMGYTKEHLKRNNECL